VTRRGRALLWAIIGAGVAIRVVIAFATYGDGPDIRAFTYAGQALLDDPLHVYGVLTTAPDAAFFYPPGSFPWFAASEGLHRLVGIPFHGVVQLAPIASDVALAWVIQDDFGRRGHGERVRLGVAAAVALGPSFGVISGYQGQIDSFGILPAVLGLLAWERMRDHPRRALAAGALVGLGGAIKITPLLVLLALLPSSRSRREGLTLCAVAAAVVLVALAPWLVSEPGAVREVLGYSGIPGAGGLSLAIQPSFAENFLTSFPPSVPPNWLFARFVAHDSLVNAVAVAGIAAFVFRTRPRPREGAVFVWLGIYVLSSAFFFQYMLWGLPFFLLAGHVRKTVLLQLALIGPAVVFYMRPWAEHWVAIPYAVVMVAVWLAFAVALANVAARLWRARPAERIA
jgi:Glycosyltransferase family 87